MPWDKAFDKNSIIYDDWFVRKQNIYMSELNAVKSFIQPSLHGVEIGAGTGRFAVPLGIRTGVEPSPNMAEIARSRGMEIAVGTAENLPFPDNTFDFALMVTAVCFFDNVNNAFQEAHRVLKENGFIVVAFIDGESDLGKFYKEHKKDNVFYRDATFYSVPEITDFLRHAGFGRFEYRQTVYNTENILHETREGYGEGSFVVIRASS